jgi:hypothetical protein
VTHHWPSDCHRLVHCSASMECADVDTFHESISMSHQSLVLTVLLLARLLSVDPTHGCATQLQELSRALETERSCARNAAGERDMLLNEARELRTQLEAARSALALAQRQQQPLPTGFPSSSAAAAGPLHQQRPPTAGSSSAVVPRLPLAAAAAAAAAGGAAALSQQQQQAGVGSPAPAAPGGMATPSRAGSSTADALGGVRLDGTPVRDQNAGATGAGLAVSGAWQQLSAHTLECVCVLWHVDRTLLLLVSACSWLHVNLVLDVTAPANLG